jgi:hypothetical protein
MVPGTVKTVKLLLISPIVLGAGLTADMVFIEPNWMQVEHVRVKSPALAPAAFRTYLLPGRPEARWRGITTSGIRADRLVPLRS